MPQPSTPTVVRCPDPACGHPIDDHHRQLTRYGRTGCYQANTVTAAQCPCEKTPNDVACALLFGELTPVPPTDPAVAEGGWRPPMDRDWS